MSIWGKIRGSAMRDAEVAEREGGRAEHAIVELLIGLVFLAVSVPTLDYRAPDFNEIMFCLFGIAFITKGIVDFMRR